jgi:NADH-quinone oxidoreductase subunit A
MLTCRWVIFCFERVTSKTGCIETDMQPVIQNMHLSPWEPGVFSLVTYTVMVLALIAVLLFIASWLGEKKKDPAKLIPYESGIIPTGSARLRYPVPFYLVAIFFLLFDVEGAFIFSWAICWEALGWGGWFQMTFFIAVLIAGLAYVWKKGGLDWGVRYRKN